MQYEGYSLFDPADLSYWPSVDKEIVDEARNALFGFMRPNHIIDKTGHYDFKGVSTKARTLIIKAMNRLEANLPVLLKRSKKHLPKDGRKVGDILVKMTLYQLLVDQSFRSAGLTAAIGEAPIEDLAIAITMLPEIISDFRSKLSGGDDG